METYGDSPEKAESNIRRADSARANYYKNISGNTWGERHNYDLLIDSSVGIEKCASAIGEFIGKRQNQWAGKYGWTSTMGPGHLV